MNNKAKTMQTTRDVIIKTLPYIKGKVLDAGGGPVAKYKEIIMGKASEYINLDIQSGGQVDVVGDVLNMPFNNNSFDTVVCNQVLEHVPDPDKLISEIFRVTKPGGHAILTAPFLEPNHADPDDYFRYTKEALSLLAKKHGFRMIEVGSYGGLWLVLFSFIRFSLFNPYKSHSSMRRRILRLLGRVFTFLDGLTKIRAIYSDVFIVAQK